MQILFRFIIGGLVVSPFAAFCRRVEAQEFCRRAHRAVDTVKGVLFLAT